jgi:hypothetical protein
MSWAGRALHSAKNFVVDEAKDVGHEVYSTGERAYDGFHDAVFGGGTIGDGSGSNGIVATDPAVYSDDGGGNALGSDAPSATDTVPDPTAPSVLGPDAKSPLDADGTGLSGTSEPTQTMGQKVLGGISSVLSVANDVMGLEDAPYELTKD